MTLDARVVDEMPGNTTRVSNTKLLGRATVLQSCELAIQSYLTISIVIGIIWNFVVSPDIIARKVHGIID